jgi:YVTN family beta-propeller protein
MSFFAPTSANSAKSPQGKIVVANRASGTISVIDVQTDQVIATVALPSGMNQPEPMYVFYSSKEKSVFVGDRANDRVVVFDADNFSVTGTAPTGAGVFHMWGDDREKLLWVNNDIDNTATLIKTSDLSVIATVPMPADLIALGGKPHDVVLDPFRPFAFVSIVGVSGDSDFVVKFNTETFNEVGRAAVGKDTHVSYSSKSDCLYVPNQVTSELIVLDGTTLERKTELSIPGTHGAGLEPNNEKTFYTTNLPGGGTDGLFAINTKDNSIIGSTDTPFAVPHNIALNTNGRKIYVTHSGGTSDKVSIYTVSNKNPVPELSGVVTVGFNPFGLAFVK